MTLPLKWQVMGVKNKSALTRPRGTVPVYTGASGVGGGGGSDPLTTLAHQWDASDESSITDSSGTVTAIADKAGSLNLDTNFGTTPTTGTITQNGLNTIDFNHADRLETTGSLATNTGDLTVMACIEVDDVTPLLGTGYLFSNGPNDDRVQVWLNSSARLNIRIGGQTELSGTVLANGFHYVALTVDTVGDEALLYVNDFSAPAMTLSGLGSLTSWDSGWAFMNRPVAGDDHLDGQFCEGAIWNGVLSASDLAALETYITDKWVP